MQNPPSKHQSPQSKQDVNSVSHLSSISLVSDVAPPDSPSELSVSTVDPNPTAFETDSIPSNTESPKPTLQKVDEWQLEDAYDASKNRPMPYTRGKVLFSRDEIRRRNQVGAHRSPAKPALYTNPSFQLCCEGDEFAIFGLGPNLCGT